MCGVIEKCSREIEDLPSLTVFALGAFGEKLARCEPDLGERCRLEQVRFEIIGLQQVGQALVERGALEDIVQRPGDRQERGTQAFVLGEMNVILDVKTRDGVNADVQAVDPHALADIPSDRRGEIGGLGQGILGGLEFRSALLLARIDVVEHQLVLLADLLHGVAQRGRRLIPKRFFEVVQRSASIIEEIEGRPLDAEQLLDRVRDAVELLLEHADDLDLGVAERGRREVAVVLRILVNEIPVAAGMLQPGWFIVRETEENLNMFEIPFERGDDFLPNTPSYWVQMKHLPLVERAGMQIMTPSSMLTYHLAHVLKSHASEFIGIQESMYLMSQMQENFAELVREATRVLPIITITDVLQRLVMEQISIRDMRTILEALVEGGQREKDPIILAEHMRGAMSRYITHKFSGGQNIIPAYLISKEIEDAVRGAVRQTSGASYLALSPDLHRQLITAMKNVISGVAPHSLPPVILAPMDIRRFMRKLIERDFPDLAVLSYQELDPSANVQPLERIKFLTQLSAA